MPQRSNDLEIVLAYFELLDSKEQLEAYREIRDRVGAEPESPEVAKVIDRANAKVEALDVFRRVAEHLGLEEGVAPTPDQFNVACKTLGLSASHSKAGRVFGSWRRACDAYLRKRVALSPGERKERTRATRGKREDYLRGVKIFLGTDPPKTTMEAYDNWVLRYNHDLPCGRLPVVGHLSVMEALDLPWRRVVAAAQGKGDAKPENSLTAERRAREEAFRVGADGFLSFCDLPKILGVSKTDVTRSIARQGFPRPVIRFGAGRLWLETEVRAYKDGKYVPNKGAKENELGSLYMSRQEVLKATGLSPRTLRSTSSKRKPLEPAIRRFKVRLWLREDVEAWKKEQSAGGA